MSLMTMKNKTYRNVILTIILSMTLIISGISVATAELVCVDKSDYTDNADGLCNSGYEPVTIYHASCSYPENDASLVYDSICAIYEGESLVEIPEDSSYEGGTYLGGGNSTYARPFDVLADAITSGTFLTDFICNTQVDQINEHDICIDGAFNVGSTDFDAISSAQLSINVDDSNIPSLFLSNSYRDITWPPDERLQFGVWDGTTFSERMRINPVGNVGIGTTSPSSALQVSGYIQLDTSSGEPPAEDCDESKEIGRMKVDSSNNNLYVCSSNGWQTK